MSTNSPEDSAQSDDMASPGALQQPAGDTEQVSVTTQTSVLNYPETLADYDPLLENSTRISSVLAHVKDSMCSPNTTNIEVLELGAGADSHQTDASTSPVPVYTVPLYTGPREDEKALSLTWDSLRSLFTDLQVSPSVLPLLYAPPTYGYKVRRSRDGLQTERKEIWFCLPTPKQEREERYHTDIAVAWAEFFPGESRSRFLLLKTPRSIQSYLRGVSHDSANAAVHGYDVLISIVRGVVEDWNGHMQLIDVLGMITNLTFQNFNDNSTSNVSEAMQDFSNQLTGLSRYDYCFKYLASLTRFLKLQIESDTRTTHQVRDKALQDLEILKSQIEIIRCKAEEVQERVQLYMNLVVNRVILRNDDTLVAHGVEMKKIAKSSEENNSSMADLAKQTREDSRAMKVLAVVTMFYLPWTSVASIFSMPFFDLDDGKGFSYLRRIWLYFVFAVPLTALTFAIWLLYYYWDPVATSLRSHGLLLFRPSKADRRASTTDSSAEAAMSLARYRLLEEEKLYNEEVTEMRAMIETYSQRTSASPNPDEAQRAQNKVLFGQISEKMKVLYQKGHELRRRRQLLDMEVVD